MQKIKVINKPFQRGDMKKTYGDNTLITKNFKIKRKYRPDNIAIKTPVKRYILGRKEKKYRLHRAVKTSPLRVILYALSLT